MTSCCFKINRFRYVSISVCMTQGYNITECLNGVEHSQNDVSNSLLVGLCEPGMICFVLFHFVVVYIYFFELKCR